MPDPIAWNVLSHDGYRFSYVAQVFAANVAEARRSALAWFGGDYRASLPFKVSRAGGRRPGGASH